MVASRARGEAWNSGVELTRISTSEYSLRYPISANGIINFVAKGGMIRNQYRNA